jgi:hypothetical protein
MTATTTDAALPRSELRVREEALWRRLADSRLADCLATAAVTLFVAAPMLFTSSGFALDFTNHIWLSWLAGRGLAEAGHPVYFINTTTAGVFEPWFAFYGGTLYTVAGGLSELIGGHPIVAYLAIAMLGIAGSYAGMLWLGRQLGLSRWMSHVPALVVVTSAYYVSNLYGRGAWTEFMACAAIPPMLASALKLTRAARWRPWPVLVFVVSTIVFTGSHNITLLWGTTVIALALAILWLALDRPRELPFRRLAMVAGLGLASLLVSAWFLVPDISYAKDVQAHLETALGEGASPAYKAFLGPTLTFDTFGALFDPLRHVPPESTVPALYVQAPDWFLIWALFAGPLLLWRRGARAAAPRRAAGRGGADPRSRRGRAAARDSAGRSARAATMTLRTERTLLRVWVGAAALFAILVLMIMARPFWDGMPFPFNAIQFPFRLNTYVFYAVSALVLISALALQRSAGEARMRVTARRLRVGLAAACVVSVGLCVWQEWVPSTLYKASYRNRNAVLASATTMPRSWYDQGSYNDVSGPIVGASRPLYFNASEVHGDRFDKWVNVPPGPAPIQTNIVGGPYLVHMSGLTQLGRNEYGFAVVRRTKSGGGPVHVVIEASHSGTIVFGWVLSILASLTVIAVIAWTAIRRLRSRAEQG